MFASSHGFRGVSLSMAGSQSAVGQSSGGGEGGACISEKQEAEMGELEDFLQIESFLGAKPHLLKIPASPSSVASWEICVQTGHRR